MERKANAIWRGNLKKGSGELSTASGALKNIPYNFSMRFEDEPGTNPEELIGAAHAGCFSMFLAGALEKKGYIADSLETSATVTLEKVGDGFTVTKSRLKLRAQVPECDAKTFNAIAEDAKANCPISRLLDAKIYLDVDFHSPFHASTSAH